MIFMRKTILSSTTKARCMFSHFGVGIKVGSHRTGRQKCILHLSKMSSSLGITLGLSLYKSDYICKLNSSCVLDNAIPPNHRFRKYKFSI